MKRIALLLLMITPMIAGAYTNDDFAVRVVTYDPGLDPVPGYTTAAAALDRPTVDTQFGFPPEKAPVVPVFPAWKDVTGAPQIVSIGSGGQLILEFGRDVEDDLNNPYGVDFIVFGNALQGSSTSWDNRDPQATTISSAGVFSEPGTVSVAQDPNGPWYTYDEPRADSFAPTLGRIYNPDDPNTSVGAFNQWWSDPTDPTLPLDPNLTPADLVGLTVAQVAQRYNGSAGGTGFDLADSGFAWIRYIKIANSNGTGVSPEIDAVAAVNPGHCGDAHHPHPPGDLNGDCTVNYADYALGAEFELLIDHWLERTWIEP